MYVALFSDSEYPILDSEGGYYFLIGAGIRYNWKGSLEINTSTGGSESIYTGDTFYYRTLADPNQWGSAKSALLSVGNTYLY